MLFAIVRWQTFDEACHLPATLACRRKRQSFTPLRDRVLADLRPLILCKADVRFGLLGCLIGVFANLGNAFVLIRWLDVDDKALLIRRANNPPIRENGISNEDPYDDSSAG